METELLTQQEAHNLTQRLRNNVNENARLMKQAWEHKVWETLGYAGFNEWLSKAVGISRTRGYQLLAIATMETQLRDTIELPEQWNLTDLHTRAIISIGAEQFLHELTTNNTGDPEKNVHLIPQLIKQHEPAPVGKPTPTTTTVKGDKQATVIPVDGGDRNHRTGLSLSNALLRQADNFPTKPAAEVCDVVVEHLTHTLSVLKDRLNLFNAAVDGGNN